MYFVCAGCAKVLRVPEDKIPARPVKYTCKACGLTSLLQDHLHRVLPQRPASGGGDAASDIGTVYHQVGSLRPGDAPAARFEMQLRVRSGEEERGYRFEASKVVVGRQGADLVVHDPLVSRHHLELERVKGTVLLKDLGSTNGTFLNDKAVVAGVVEPEDEIRLGNTCIRVRVLIS